jgi:hypothetical protein
MLLEVNSKVNPAGSQSHVTYSFHLKRPVAALYIRFSYTPKRLEDSVRSKALILAGIDKYTAPEHREYAKERWKAYLSLQNLITVSVDDPERHRGTGHRHDPEQLIRLGVREASPGFLSGPLPQGLWKITLSMHAIVTEVCSYELQIWEQEEVC